MEEKETISQMRDVDQKESKFLRSLWYGVLICCEAGAPCSVWGSVDFVS